VRHAGSPTPQRISSESGQQAARNRPRPCDATADGAAFIQRYQVHKKRNVVDHLPDEHKAYVKRRLQNAYAMADCDAKRALERLHRELMDLNPSAAQSLEEGLEETLTVHKLRLPDQLRRTLCCTQRNRVRVLHRRNRAPERETLADR
jgi:transposase-like protein